MATSNVVLITGAGGGIGRACARRLGGVRSLYLTDLDAGRLDAFAASLREEGYEVCGTLAGDLAEPSVAEVAVSGARAAGRLASVVHAAGLSPALGDWRVILKANVVATERLLLALEAGLDEGLVAVLLASMAGHVAPPDAELDALSASPLADDYLDKAEPRLNAPGMAEFAASAAYNQSKRAVIRTCAARCVAWGVKDARIVSVSPGLVWTPMGRQEVETTPGASMVKDMAPIRRWGRPSDIADAVDFLCSDRASFITGTDLRIDGGATPALQAAMVAG